MRCDVGQKWLAQAVSFEFVAPLTAMNIKITPRISKKVINNSLRLARKPKILEISLIDATKNRQVIFFSCSRIIFKRRIITVKYGSKKGERQK
jgi:hypothetical protein